MKKNKDRQRNQKLYDDGGGSSREKIKAPDEHADSTATGETGTAESAAEEKSSDAKCGDAVKDKKMNDGRTCDDKSETDTDNEEPEDNNGDTGSKKEESASESGNSDETEGDSESDDTGEAKDTSESGDAREAEEASAGGQAQEEDEAADNETDRQESKEDTPEEDSGRLNHWKKKEKKELEQKDEKIAQLTNQCQRTMAEFDNYRKRTEKEKASMYGMGVKDVVEKVLPVIDNFERGFSQVTEDDEQDPFVTGMQAIYKQFQTVLEGIGIKPIEAVGKEFDPNLHNAVMHVEDESVGDNMVVEELQKGYMYHDQVVRHSMVKVAN